jgi:hypothetical protein
MSKKMIIGLSLVIAVFIIVLAGWFYFSYEIEDIGTDNRRDEIIERTESMIIDQGSKVTVAFNSAELYQGDHLLFGIGILNLLGSESNFTSEIKLSEIYDEEENNITSQLSDDEESSKLVIYDMDSIKLDDNEHFITFFLIDIPENARKGNYIFDGTVFSNGSQYGDTQKFHIIVR